MVTGTRPDTVERTRKEVVGGLNGEDERLIKWSLSRISNGTR